MKSADISKVFIIAFPENGKAKKALFQARLKTFGLPKHVPVEIIEVPEKELEKTSEVVKSAMESAVKLAVPLPVELGSGKNWMDAKP